MCRYDASVGGLVTDAARLEEGQELIFTHGQALDPEKFFVQLAAGTGLDPA